MLMRWTGFRSPEFPAVHIWISERRLIQAAIVSDRQSDLIQRTLQTADDMNATAPWGE